MSIINEAKMIEILSSAKNVLLLEPPFVRRHIPLGLSKIASFLKRKNINVEYSRSPVNKNFDLICVSTIFTTDSEIVIKTIKQCQSNLILRNTPILVGGIFASLMSDYLDEQTNKKVNIFAGYSPILDSYIPDESLDWQIKDFFKDVMTIFTQRGCPNKCGFCMVHKLESHYKILPKWRETIEKTGKSVCQISDNNLLYAPLKHVQDVIETLNKNKKLVILNNGVDCELINDENAKLLASLKYVRNGFRTAFDDMSQDGHYQKAMEKMINAGFKFSGKSYTYILFNFNDTPQEAYYRVKEAWKFKSNPYFMKFRPLNQLTKKNSYVGKYWSENLLRAFKNYGEIYGYNRGDRTFESYSINEKSKIKLTDEDWEKWNFKR